MKIYDNHYILEKDLRSPQMTDMPSPRYGPKGAGPTSRPLGSIKSKDLAHSAVLDPDPVSLRQRLIGTRRRVEQG